MGEYVNSKQARFDKSAVSCGVVEVHHLPDQSASQTAFSITNHLYNKANGRPAAFVLFSDTVDRAESRGVLLAKFITELAIGKLISSSQQINPKTGNLIRVWLWELDHTKLRAWYTEEYTNRVSEA